MTSRIKTIEYGFASDVTSRASFIYGAHPELTIYIPERTTRSFKSVFLYQYAQQNVAAAASVTSFSSSFRLFGGDATTPGVQLTRVTASTQTNSGECLSAAWVTDLTSYFNTNFSSSYQTVNLACSGGMNPGPFANLASKLVITYQFEDSTVTGSNTLIKTVRIPQEGNNTTLTTTLAFRDVIPALDTFCPEANKTFRNIFFEIDGQTGTSAAAAPDPGLTMSLDAEAGVANFGITDTLVSAQYYYGIWQRNDMDTANIHRLSASVGNTATPYPCLSTILYATYEYEPASTTSVLNSIMMPVLDDAGNIGGNTTALKTRFTRTFPIVDAGPILLVSSAVKLYYSDGAALTVDIRAGSQPSRQYTHAATVRAGSCSAQRRIDAGAIGGAGLTLDRGLNTLTLDIFRTGTTAGTLGSNLNGVMYLNYTSSINPSGAESHPKTVLTLLQEMPATLAVPLVTVSSAIRVPTIPEPYYYLYSGGAVLPTIWSGTAHLDTWLTMHCSVEANEAEAAGWRALYVGTMTSDSETGVYPSYTFAPETWKRFPNKVDGDNVLLNYTQMKQYRLASQPASAVSLQGWHLTTYHSRMFEKTGSVYPNPGAGASIKIFRNDTHEMITTCSTDANGRYSFAYHNDTVDLFAETRISDTLAGRSSLFRVTASI